jgi:uncharacterized RDD family membrane protein YckC
MSADASLPTAGLWRRLAALLYDAFLLVALLMIATAFFLAFTGGENVESGGPVLLNFYRVAMVGVWVAFYGVFWTRGGQTLGMKVWRLKLVRESGEAIRWSDVLSRLAAGVLSLAPAGLGFFWILFDRDGLAWHDRLSHTQPVVLPKPAKR